MDSLPGDIDGKKLYILPFDPSKRMLSSKDGRNWDTWKTSSNKTYKVRRLAKCKGGWKCVNPRCDFSKTFNKQNSYYLKFETVSSEQVAFCKIKGCEKKCVKLTCECVKIWEFDDNTNLVRVLHDGFHECIPRKVVTSDDKKLHDYFKNNSKTTPMQASRDVVIEAFDTPDITKEDLDKVIDSSIDRQHVRYVKRQHIQENRPFGHSFEAVGQFKAKMSSIDKFLVYRINNRLLNGKISYVFKTSKRQLKIAISMDENGDGALSSEFCFFDGTSKRCPEYVTLAGHVYFPHTGEMVKLFTMETESESTECVALCLTIFNEALKEYADNLDITFNPSGWDEGEGLWAGLKLVFGIELEKKGVSCEWHYKNSRRPFPQK